MDVRPELPLAKTGTPALGGTLSETQVEQLPVNGRDLISLAYLIPGAAPARGFYNLAPRLTINGSSSLVTNYTVDGFDNTDLFLGGPKVPVTIGSTQNLAVMVNCVLRRVRPHRQRRLRGDDQVAAGSATRASCSTTCVPEQHRLAELLRADGRRRRRHRRQLPAPPVRRRRSAARSARGTFYFVNGEVTRESQDAILTSPLARRPRADHVPQPDADGQDRSAVERRRRSRRSGIIFSDYTHDDDIGFVGGLTLPSAGLQVNYHNNSSPGTIAAVMASGLNELGRHGRAGCAPTGGRSMPARA